jgi:DNA primase
MDGAGGMIPDLAARIKEALPPMTAVFERYGFHLNRAGFISCPFHENDNTPSLKVYEDSWHCHACGAGRDAIDFVRRLFNISFPAALVRLNADFGLNLTSERPDPAEIEKYRRERAVRDLQSAIDQFAYNLKVAEHRRLWTAKMGGDPDDPEYAEACKRLDEIEYWFEETPWK